MEDVNIGKIEETYRAVALRVQQSTSSPLTPSPFPLTCPRHRFRKGHNATLLSAPVLHVHSTWCTTNSDTKAMCDFLSDLRFLFATFKYYLIVWIVLIVDCILLNFRCNCKVLLRQKLNIRPWLSLRYCHPTNFALGHGNGKRKDAQSSRRFLRMMVPHPKVNPSPFLQIVRQAVNSAGTRCRNCTCTLDVWSVYSST